MANYQIELTEEAKEDVYYYDAFERKIIVSGIRDQLSDQPDVETKNRKPLREKTCPVGSAYWQIQGLLQARRNWEDCDRCFGRP